MTLKLTARNSLPKSAASKFQTFRIYGAFTFVAELVNGEYISSVKEQA
jgi:hypothetical protein